MTRILIIDDEVGVRASLDRTLTSVGYEVLLAQNGREGLEQQQKFPAAAAIIDVFMPDHDGLETITAFRRDYPAVPIIAMSGYDSSGTMLSMAKELGATRILD